MVEIRNKKIKMTSKEEESCRPLLQQAFVQKFPQGWIEDACEKIFNKAGHGIATEASTENGTTEESDEGFVATDMEKRVAYNIAIVLPCLIILFGLTKSAIYHIGKALRKHQLKQRMMRLFESKTAIRGKYASNRRGDLGV